MNPLRSSEQAGYLVLDDGIVLPRVPVAEYDFHELVSPIVAQVVPDDFIAAHVLRLAVIKGRDDVPSRPPIGHQIERRKQACHMEWLVVAGRIGRAETEPLGRHAHHGEHRHRIQLHAANAMPNRVRVIAPVHVGHRQTVIEKAEVKFALLKHAADMPVVVRRPGIGA